jgi:tetratricopeptide (TPR) repeat protein
MSLALNYSMSACKSIGEEEIKLIDGFLNRRIDSVSKFPSQDLLIGNLYWLMENNSLAIRHWVEGGIDASFFIEKVDNTTGKDDLDYIERALALSPTRSEILYYKGFYLEKHGDGKSAEYWYRRASLQSNWVDSDVAFSILYEHAALLFEQGEWKEAEKVLLKAEEVSSGLGVDNARDLAMINRWLGMIYQNWGEIQASRSRFLWAIELYPEDFWNYLSLALIAETEKQPPEVVFEYFDRAREVAPLQVYAYVYPAKHYLGLNQLNKWRYFCEETPKRLRQDSLWKETCVPSE